MFEERKSLTETDKSILDALEKIDVQESNFKNLMSRYKLEKILSFYLGGAEEADGNITNFSVGIENSPSFGPKKHFMLNNKFQRNDSGSDGSVSNSELHLDLDSIIKPV